jgi:hypothetical protein
MTTKRKRLYNDKGYWKQRFKRFDIKVLETMNREQVKGLTVPITDYFDLGATALDLGETGEEILERAVAMGLDKTLLRDVYNLLNRVQTFSEGLRAVAQKKWAFGELKHFPVYLTKVPTWSTIEDEMDAVKAMREELS